WAADVELLDPGGPEGGGPGVLVGRPERGVVARIDVDEAVVAGPRVGGVDGAGLGQDRRLHRAGGVAGVAAGDVHRPERVRRRLAKGHADGAGGVDVQAGQEGVNAGALVDLAL